MDCYMYVDADPVIEVLRLLLKDTWKIEFLVALNTGWQQSKMLHSL